MAAVTPFATQKSPEKIARKTSDISLQLERTLDSNKSREKKGGQYKRITSSVMLCVTDKLRC